MAAPGLKSFLHLSDPLVLGGQWTYHWFDPSRQEMLLFRENTFYVWSPCSADPGPKEIYCDTSFPVKIVYAKVSIDGNLLVVQISRTSMLVLDIENKKKWRVDIKYLSGNEILENGLIWSEHGGNSQDLVIVTSRGLELYKVSVARGQCKLSRNISLKISYFWFEPNFRVILTAVPGRSNTLDFAGFFLRFDMSDMPRLELPPPDRMPAFSVGSNVSPQDITLVTLYGSLYCIVRYEEQSGDRLSLFHITRNKVEKMYSFSLYVSSPVKISVTDNVLSCHCLLSNMSFLYDIKMPSGHLGSSTDGIQMSVVDYSCGACTMTVEKERAMGVAVPRKNSHSAASLGSSSSLHVTAPIAKWGSKDATSQGELEGINLSMATGFPSNVLLQPGSESAEWSDAVGVGGERGNSMDLMPPESGSSEYTRSRQNTMGSSASPVVSSTGRKSFVSVQAQHPSASASAPPHSSDAAVPSNRHTPPARKSITDSPGTSSVAPVSVRHAVEPYEGKWEILGPYWVWDGTSQCLWKMKCQLSSIVASMNEPRRVVGFLSKRGCAVEAPRPCYYSDLEDGYDAKKLLLRKAARYWEDGQLSPAATQAFLEELVANYALEYHRRGGGELSLRREESGTLSGSTNYSSSENTGGYDSSSAIGGGDEDIDQPDSSGAVLEYDGRPISPPVEVKSPRGMLATFRRITSEGNIENKRGSKKFGMLGTLSLNRGNSETRGVAYTPPQDEGPESAAFSSHLYSDAPNKRRASMNTQMIAAAHVARLNEYKQVQQTAWSDDSNVSGPLEPSLAVDVFFPDILSIGSRAFGNRTQDRSFPTSAPPPVHAYRNQRSCIYCTQTEILSYVALPVALRVVDCDGAASSADSSSCSVNGIISILLTYFATLRTHDIPINLSLSLLFVNLLVYQKRFLDISHFVQLQFLTDSAELGMAILDISDSLEDELNTQSTGGNEILGANFFLSRNHKEGSPLRGPALRAKLTSIRRDMLHAVSSMRQAGTDMLWRVNERTVVVRWMLSHGKVSDAMLLCTKTKGIWKNGLSPMGISGLDFFRSAMSELCRLREMGLLSATLHLPIAEVSQGRSPASLSWKTSKFSKSKKRRAYRVIADIDVQSTEQQGVNIMRTVHHFLNSWDPSLLTVQKLTGKSRLASLAHFPDDIFSESNSCILKELFGF